MDMGLLLFQWVRGRAPLNSVFAGLKAGRLMDVIDAGRIFRHRSRLTFPGLVAVSVLTGLSGFRRSCGVFVLRGQMRSSRNVGLL